MIPKILKSTLFRAPCKKLYVGSKNDCNLLIDLDVLHYFAKLGGDRTIMMLAAVFPRISVQIMSVYTWN